LFELYQLAISHYCEKARWALDHKQLEWRPRTMLPGLHVKPAMKLSGQSSLPILVDDGQAIHGSSRILDHLDDRYPDRSLTPGEPELRRQALEWERFADERIGDDVRRICYHELLARPDVVIPLMTAGGPWYGRFLLRRIFGQLESRMRRYMKIDAEETTRSRERLATAVSDLMAGLADRRYLVGDRFTRADLAVCALLAPLAMPAGYGVPWPRELPPALAAEAERHAQALDWVSAIYAEHRPIHAPRRR
jgi:glutathione S-transferase